MQLEHPIHHNHSVASDHCHHGNFGDVNEQLGEWSVGSNTTQRSKDSANGAAKEKGVNGCVHPTVKLTELGQA